MEQKNNLKILYSIILKKLNKQFIKKGKQLKINQQLKTSLFNLKKKKINIVLFIYYMVKYNNIYLKIIKKKKININTISKMKQLNQILKNIKNIKKIKETNFPNKISTYQLIEKNKYNIN